MVNARSLISPAAAAGIGVVSPFLPRFAGQPFLALALAIVAAFLVPAKSKAYILLFMFVWVIAFTVSSAFFAAGV